MPETGSTLKNLLLLSWVLVVVSRPAFSQHSDPALETITVYRGMQTNVRYVIQDKIGYLWFGTWNGLYRYDGYSFVPFRYDIDDTSSLAENHVFALYEDKAGVLWAGTGVGLEKFDRTTSTFQHYVPHPSSTKEYASNNVTAICEDNYGVLWVGTPWGVYQFDKAAGTFTALRYDTTDPGSIFHNRVNAIYEDKEGSLWFATAGGLDRYDFETRTFVHYWNDPVNRYCRDVGTSKHWVTSLCEDEAGILLALLDEEKEAGTYELEFSINAADAVLDGALSPSESVYVYHFQAGNFSATKKMTAMICPTQTGQEEGPAC